MTEYKLVEKTEDKILEEKAEDKKKAKAEALKKCQLILKEYGGMESNIPYNHEYWTVRNIYQAE